MSINYLILPDLTAVAIDIQSTKTANHANSNNTYPAVDNVTSVAVVMLRQNSVYDKS